MRLSFSDLVSISTYLSMMDDGSDKALTGLLKRVDKSISDLVAKENN